MNGILQRPMMPSICAFSGRKTDWEAAIEEYNRTLVMTGSIEQMAEVINTRAHPCLIFIYLTFINISASQKHGKEERLMLAMTAVRPLTIYIAVRTRTQSYA